MLALCKAALLGSRAPGTGKLGRAISWRWGKCIQGEHLLLSVQGSTLRVFCLEKQKSPSAPMSDLPRAAMHLLEKEHICAQGKSGAVSGAGMLHRNTAQSQWPWETGVTHPGHISARTDTRRLNLALSSRKMKVDSSQWIPPVSQSRC